MWYPAVIQLMNDSFGTGPQNYVIFQLRDFFLSRCNPLSMLSFVKLHGALLIFLIIIIIIWYVVVFFPTTYCDRLAQKMRPNKNQKKIFSFCLQEFEQVSRNQYFTLLNREVGLTLSGMAWRCKAPPKKFRNF